MDPRPHRAGETSILSDPVAILAPMNGTAESAPAPTAFVSHSSQDKERFVLPFAAALRSDYGIDAWVDIWEIHPGDSFVDRIFTEGIGRADAFLVVISMHSIQSSWVRDELDAATVKRINDSARLIPIILDSLDHSNIPTQLHHLQWIRVDDPSDPRAVAAAASEVARAIREQPSPARPELGPQPGYSRRTTTIPGLGSADVAVLLAIGDRVLSDSTGFVRDPKEVIDDLYAQGMDDNTVLSSVRFLHELGLLRDQPIRQSGQIRILWLSQAGVGAYLRAMDVDIDALRRALATFIVNHPDRRHHYKDLAETLDAAPLAIAHVAEDFHQRGLLRVTKAMGDQFEIGHPTESLRRMVRDG